jgi:predicted acetyltransferase
MLNLKLVQPDERYRRSYIKGMLELQAEGLSWYADIDFHEVDARFADHVAAERDRARKSPRPDFVKETRLWGILDDEHFAGKISIRHELNDSLKVMGGHIGYDTVPSFRRQGVGSRMLELALPLARQLGLQRVLLTCDDNNHGSIRIIEKNGGVLESKRLLAADKPLKRYYWIDL